MWSLAPKSMSLWLDEILLLVEQEMINVFIIHTLEGPDSYGEWPIWIWVDNVT